MQKDQKFSVKYVLITIVMEKNHFHFGLSRERCRDSRYSFRFGRWVFTVDDQPLRDQPPGRVVTGLATIVARVPRPERLEGQHAIVIVHACNGGGRAQRAAGVVLGPRDGQRQVAADHRARDAGPLAHVHRPFRGQRAQPWRHCTVRGG